MSRAGSSWRREAEFREILGRDGRLKREEVDKLTKIALEDARECYKHVCLLVEKAIRRANPKDRFSALHLLSSILRASRSQLKDKDKYCLRLKDRIPKIFESLADIPKLDQAKLAGILQIWKKESIFSSETISSLEASAGVVTTSANNSGTNGLKSGKQLESSAISPKKRKAIAKDYNPSHSGPSGNCHNVNSIRPREKSRKSSHSSRASDWGAETSGRQHKHHQHNGERDGLKTLPPNIVFNPGQEDLEVRDTKRLKAGKSSSLPAAKIPERLLPGVHMIRGINGECHDPLWPVPKVLPPLQVPEGSVKMYET